MPLGSGVYALPAQLDAWPVRPAGSGHETADWLPDLPNDWLERVGRWLSHYHTTIVPPGRGWSAVLFTVHGDLQESRCHKHLVVIVNSPGRWRDLVHLDPRPWEFNSTDNHL